jgi:hypothetical protein
MLAAARTLGLELHVLNASTESDFDPVFAKLRQLRVNVCHGAERAWDHVFSRPKIVAKYNQPVTRDIHFKKTVTAQC